MSSSTSTTPTTVKVFRKTTDPNTGRTLYRSENVRVLPYDNKINQSRVLQSYVQHLVQNKDLARYLLELPVQSGLKDE